MSWTTHGDAGAPWEADGLIPAPAVKVDGSYPSSSSYASVSSSEREADSHTFLRCTWCSLLVTADTGKIYVPQARKCRKESPPEGSIPSRACCLASTAELPGGLAPSEEAKLRLTEVTMAHIQPLSSRATRPSLQFPDHTTESQAFPRYPWAPNSHVTGSEAPHLHTSPCFSPGSNLPNAVPCWNISFF